MVLSGRSGWALQLPVLFGLLSGLCSFGAYAALSSSIGVGQVFSALLAIGLVLLTASELRWIRVQGTRLLINSPFGCHELPAQEVAFGIRIHYGGRGGPNYHIYAESGGMRRDLATALTRKGSERLRHRLQRDLLGGRPPTQGAEANQQAVAAAEARQAAQAEEARRVVASYYKGGGGRRATLIVLAFVGLNVLIGLVAYVLRGG